MQSSDLKLLSVGILSLGLIGYYLNKYTQDQHEYRQKIEEFKKCYQQSQKDRNKMLKDIMKSKNQDNNKQQQFTEKKFCFLNVKPTYNDSTFSLYERERSIFQKLDKYPNNQILEHQMGGDFSFQSDSNHVTCQLNDFYLSGQLLKVKEKTPVHVFEGMNKVKPLVNTVLTALNPYSLVSIYGKLYFDGDQFRWTIEPQFLTPGNSLKSTIESFYNEKIRYISYLKFGIIVSAIVAGYFTVFKPLQRYFSKKKEDPKVVQYNNDIEFFKNKEYISVKGENLLNCQICKFRNVQMVYECGHLILCKQCHEVNTEKICPLCNKYSTRFMKIFMA